MPPCPVQTAPTGTCTASITAHLSTLCVVRTVHLAVESPDYKALRTGTEAPSSLPIMQQALTHRTRRSFKSFSGRTDNVLLILIHVSSKPCAGQGMNTFTAWTVSKLTLLVVPNSTEPQLIARSLQTALGQSKCKPHKAVHSKKIILL